MDTTNFIGPIAKPIGAFGGDVGNEMSLVCSLIYIPARYLELKYVGR
jgi:hypothetical protein